MYTKPIQTCRCWDPGLLGHFFMNTHRVYDLFTAIGAFDVLKLYQVISLVG